MNQTSLTRLATAALLFALAGSLSLRAQPAGAPGGLRVSLQGSHLHQFETELDDGSEMSLSRSDVGLDLGGAIGRRSRWGVSFGYGLSNYDFSLPNDESLPWDTIDEVHHVGIGASWFRQLENDWQVFVRPGVSLDSESAFDSDGLTYALIAGGRKQWSETLAIGIGAVASGGLEEFRAFPFLSIKWDFAPGWTLQNPMRPGPAGMAGLEVAYAADSWSLGMGATYRSWRFRIDGDGMSTDGIAEHRGAPIYFRFTQALGESLSFDLYGGAVLGGSLEIEDRDGRSLGLKEDLDVAPFAAISVSGRF